MMAHYLVTGGCGFIGSCLTEQLIEQGHQVTVIDNLSNSSRIHPDAHLVKEDIRQLNSIQHYFESIDGCFHLAALPTVDQEFKCWLPEHAINLTGSLNVFKSALDAGGVPVVYASSCAVYSGSKQFPLAETQHLEPFSAYGCDKLSTELNAHFLHHAFELPSIGFRFFNVYGPHQPPTSPYSGVITRFISNILEDKPITIYGDGEQTRDFIFVGDVADNLIRAMQQLKTSSNIINLCTGVVVTVNDLARTIAGLLDKKVIKNYEPSRFFDEKQSVGCTKKMREHGYEVRYTLKDGLRETIASWC